MVSLSTDRAMKTWVLVLTSAASFMAILDAMVVATALSAIRADLGASIELLEWTVNAYNLSFAVLLTALRLMTAWGVGAYSSVAPRSCRRR